MQQWRPRQTAQAENGHGHEDRSSQDDDDGSSPGLGAGGSARGSTPLEETERDESEQFRGEGSAGDQQWNEAEWYEGWSDWYDGRWSWNYDPWWSWGKSDWAGSSWRSNRDVHVARAEETTMVRNGKWQGFESQATGSSTRGEDPEGDAGGRGRPGEKLVVPSFSGEGSDAELGSTARSYLRKVSAWLRCTKMAERDRAVALYSNLTGKAWIFAEELDMDRLCDGGGVEYFQEWIRVRFMEMEVTKVSNVMTELFRRCRKKQDQSVRDFNVEFERLLLYLKELDCELPPCW